MSDNVHPAAIASFRESTHNSKMPGVMWNYTFQCKQCKKHKPVKGRVCAVKGTRKFGYICSDCVGGKQ